MESKPVDRGSGYTLGSGRSGEDGGGQGQVAQTLAVALCVASLFLFLDVRWEWRRWVGVVGGGHRSLVY